MSFIMGTITDKMALCTPPITGVIILFSHPVYNSNISIMKVTL